MATKAARIDSIDALRGVVMIVMALDHVRDFFHRGAMTDSPTNMATTTAAVFLTRWITHFCAPVFLFTAGLGAYFWWKRSGRSRGQLSRHLVARGLWLILLELTVMRLAFDFALSRESPVLLITLWALGASMIVLAALVWLPVRVLAGLSVAAIALHNLLDPVRAGRFGSFGWLWNMLHQPGGFAIGGVTVVVGYPVLSFAATMAAGFACGVVFDGATRRAVLLRVGIGLTAAFVVLRLINVYGDPIPWRAQGSAAMTVLSFLNCTKYPGSLDFLLMTLGPALILLSWLDGKHFSRRNPLIVFGREPLFYFLGHFFLGHVILVAASWMRYGAVLLRPPPSMGGPRELFPPDFGYPLWVVYVVWSAVVTAMYPLCLWFARAKATARGYAASH